MLPGLGLHPASTLPSHGVIEIGVSLTSQNLHVVGNILQSPIHVEQNLKISESGH